MKTTKKQWYNVRQIGNSKWEAFELNPKNLPKLNKGYEMTGPYKSLFSAWEASNKTPKP